MDANIAKNRERFGKIIPKFILNVSGGYKGKWNEGKGRGGVIT